MTNPLVCANCGLDKSEHVGTTFICPNSRRGTYFIPVPLKEPVELKYWDETRQNIEKMFTPSLRDQILATIENGGTGDTIMTIQHNGETFINERQLLKALESLLQRLERENKQN